MCERPFKVWHFSQIQTHFIDHREQILQAFIHVLGHIVFLPPGTACPHPKWPMPEQHYFNPGQKIEKEKKCPWPPSKEPSALETLPCFPCILKKRDLVLEC